MTLRGASALLRGLAIVGFVWSCGSRRLALTTYAMARSIAEKNVFPIFLTLVRAKSPRATIFATSCARALPCLPTPFLWAPIPGWGVVWVGGQARRWDAWGHLSQRWSGGVNSTSMRFTPMRRTSNPASSALHGPKAHNRHGACEAGSSHRERQKPRPEAGLDQQGRQEQGQGHHKG
eukprot:2294320-Prymnesium_polylepis.1